MLRAHLIDLWLFVRRISRNVLGIVILLLSAATAFYAADTWPESSFLDCFINAFYIMSLEAVELPDRWYLEVLILILPLLGMVLAGEALVSATTLFLNKSRRQGEWNAVVASTYRDHTVICGLGQFGLTLCNGLADAGEEVVVVEIDSDLAAVVTAKRRDVTAIIGDMTRRETLEEANIPRAKCVVMCSGDDLANIEASIVAREMNDTARVSARVVKESFARRINAALLNDIKTFSPYATAAQSILATLRLAEDESPPTD